ncbi:MAG: hypothetical protein JJE22_09430 [Bacteroidia bacterium]|nr:hypothetical protein [Bacteroidia bacterium]
MKIFFLYISLFFASSVIAQSLRDSLFGGKLKADTGKTVVSTDTGKYVPPKVYNIPAQIGSQKRENEAKKDEIIKPDESMPDSLNKSFYAKQKTWKRFIEINTGIITQQANDTRKVKKGEYSIEIQYEIGLNGKIKTTGITCNPSNEYLTEQVTELMKRTPTLSPPVYSDGKPGTLNATQSLIIIKK